MIHYKRKSMLKLRKSNVAVYCLLQDTSLCFLYHFYLNVDNILYPVFTLSPFHLNNAFGVVIILCRFIGICDFLCVYVSACSHLYICMCMPLLVCAPVCDRARAPKDIREPLRGPLGHNGNP